MPHWIGEDQSKDSSQQRPCPRGKTKAETVYRGKHTEKKVIATITVRQEVLKKLKYLLEDNSSQVETCICMDNCRL